MNDLTKENFLKDLSKLIDKYEGYMRIEDGDNYADTDGESYESYWSEPYKVFEITFRDLDYTDDALGRKEFDREEFTVTVDDFQKIVDGWIDKV